jgi:transposase
MSAIWYWGLTDWGMCGIMISGIEDKHYIQIICLSFISKIFSHLEAKMVKICTKCKKEKEIDEFVKDKNSSDGRGKTCKTCYNKIYKEWYHSKSNAIKKKQYQDKMDKIAKRVSLRKSQLKKSYGMTLEEFEKIQVEQDNLCSICGQHRENFSKNFSVDHDHSTGKNRGLLCNTCNTLLGCAKDNVFILINAI